ncbi:MAG TPA: metalloregulator ArsR/SmtB family transcription factor [Thermoanaerobaculia bacterium]|nr:metalloregulator ArsR/SmtB family transcription factor [Thermoanaerobaculia bacterium]
MKLKGNVFAALADPTRRQILQELKDGELPAGEIVARFSLSGPAISRHLSILETAGLVASRREANRIYYRVETEPLADTLGDFLSAVCPTQIVYRRKKRKA